MKDRIPGAPGQFKAMILPDQFAALQNGEEFTIKLVRDDQPLVEGTPYSKAAVLPDELAAILCPDIEDPTPANAFAALLPKARVVEDMNSMTGMLGHIDAGVTKNAPCLNGIAIRRNFGTWEMQYVFGLANPGKIYGRAKEQGVWNDWDSGTVDADKAFAYAAKCFSPLGYWMEVSDTSAIDAVRYNGIYRLTGNLPVADGMSICMLLHLNGSKTDLDGVAYAAVQIGFRYDGSAKLRVYWYDQNGWSPWKAITA